MNGMKVAHNEVQEGRQQVPVGEPSRGDDGDINSIIAQPSAPPDAGTNGPRQGAVSAPTKK